MELQIRQGNKIQVPLWEVVDSISGMFGKKVSSYFSVALKQQAFVLSLCKLVF